MKINLLILGSCVLLGAVANGQLLTEHFAYPNANLGAAGSGDAVWTGGDSASTAITVNSNAALNYAGLFGPSGSGIVFSGGTFKKKAAPFTAQTGGAVYVSFLLNIQTAGASAKLLAYLQDGNSASSSPPMGIYLNGLQVGLAKFASTPAVSTGNLSSGTHLVVARYSFLGGNDQVDLWVDPTSLGSNTIPAATLTTGTASSSDAASLSYVFLNHAVNQTVWLDEFRVGTTWAEVTPTDGTTPPPAGNSTPVFTSIVNSPAGLVMQGTNGSANAAFDLIASANVMLPLNQWNDVSSDNFDAGGNFILTNPIAPSAPQLFYRIRVGSGTPPPVAPNITVSPTNLNLLAGQTAQFHVTATGTTPLSYRWFFNTNTLVGSGAALTINNVQTNNAGAYFAIVTNVAGSATSSVATLSVSNVLLPAGIVTQPQDQTVPAGQTAVFNVIASGTPPLFYQWLFNTNTPLANQTNASLMLANASNINAGAYSVIVSNAYGTTNSAFATLAIDTNAPLDFSPIGFCNNGATITGGAGGPTVYVGNEAELQAYADVNPPYIIYITNSFPLSGMSTHIRSNKTVIGLGNVVLSGGGLYLYRSSNVIIRNLTITGSTEDGVGIHYSSAVWVDHCTITDSSDGAIDITQESDNVTVSWCHIYYSSPTLDHRLASLIASSDADTGTYRVTYHHNWWGENVQERMPSVRFGRAHIFNNYYSAAGNNYCVRTRKEAECLVENNFFQNVQNPWEQYITSPSHIQGKLAAVGNNVPFLGTANGVSWTGSVTNGDGTIRMMIPGTDTVFTPPYGYSLRLPAGVPNVVTNNAGAGRGPFAP
jgi:pectate lyase